MHRIVISLLDLFTPRHFYLFRAPSVRLRPNINNYEIVDYFLSIYKGIFYGFISSLKISLRLINSSFENIEYTILFYRERINGELTFYLNLLVLED